MDGIIASTTYSDLGPLHETLRTLGFRQKPGESVHLHRWWSREDDPFDLVLAGAHLGGSSQPWDRIALKNTVDVHLGDAVTIRHANAAAFLGLKWAAYIDRGASDPYGSHDLEDILGVVVSRPSIVEEIRRSDPELRAFVSAQTAALLEDNRLHDLLAGHLNNAQDPVRTVRRAVERLREIWNLTASD